MASEFWPGAVLLLTLALPFLLFPGFFLRRRRQGGLSSNRDWFLQREAELAGKAPDTGVDESQREDLLREARLRLLEDTDTDIETLTEGAPDPVETVTAGRAWIGGMAVLVAVLSVFLYTQLGASGDVELKRQLDSFTGEGSEADYRRLMLQVEDRAAQRPDNLYYQAMLGNFYMEEGDYGRARDLYRAMAEKVPEDAAMAARAAQAGFLANDRQLTPEDQLLAERALSIDPHQRTALGMLGMVSYEQGQYQLAISYWRRLLVMEDPTSSSAQMIQGIIARAEAALAAGGSEVAAAAVPPHSVAAGAPASAPAAGTPAAGTPAAGTPATGSVEADQVGITLRLELAQGARAAPGDTVFVFARNPAIQSRMPVAVQRLTASQLPLTLRLDDGNSMAGQKISELDLVDVVARVSPSGQPGEQHATLQASIASLPPGQGEQVHTLVLRPVGDS